ncbi:MAG TPA: hypothetical protein DHW45_19910 [Candidatus Latescibacteria bacterium]|nr:hypothetical protein [Candidatus Latescibacterota bacterium]
MVLADPTQSAYPTPVESRLTLRSLICGLILAIVVIVWNTYVEYIAHTARMNITHFPIALFVPYTVLTLVNALFRKLGAVWAFTSAELLTMLAMGLVGAAVPAYGLTSYFLGMIAIPYYLATPENQWAGFFHQYLPTWLIPSNEGDAMRWLFEGLPSPEMPIPWGVWTVPLIGWLTFIGAIVVGSVCFSVMLRKHWADHERLAYPILHPAADLAEAEEKTPLLSNRIFWIGAVIPFSILAWNMVSYFNSGFPVIRLGTGWMNMGAYFPRMHISFNFYTVGFAYFANVDVLFSIWAFYLFYCTQIAVYRRVWISLSNKSGSGDATTSLQAGGAFISLIFWGIWLARGHLKDVFKKAFNRDHPVDDSQELISYRACVFGLAFSVVFLILWLQAIGIDWTVSVVVTFGIFLLYMGAARVIAETGVVYFSMPMAPTGVIPFLFGGPNALDGSTQTALRLIDSVRSQNKAMFMPPLVHAARIGDLITHNKRRLIGGIGVTLFAGTGVAIIYSLYLGYIHGAYNFNDFPFTRYPPRTYDGLVKALKGEEKWEPERYLFLLGGIITFSLVSIARYRLTWWPLAPIGMVVPPTHAVHSIFSVFCTWAIKSIILRIGGVDLYRRMRPLFLGLLVGHALGVLLSFVIDQIYFPGQGHHTHSW